MNMKYLHLKIIWNTWWHNMTQYETPTIWLTKMLYTVLHLMCDHENHLNYLVNMFQLKEIVCLDIQWHIHSPAGWSLVALNGKTKIMCFHLRPPCSPWKQTFYNLKDTSKNNTGQTSNILFTSKKGKTMLRSIHTALTNTDHEVMTSQTFHYPINLIQHIQFYFNILFRISQCRLSTPTVDD